jgi:hypothetical protein
MSIDTFLDSYNKLDEFMRSKLGCDMAVSHAKLLTRMSLIDNVFSRMETKLQAYRALRNAIVHIHHEGETPIAIPNLEVVSDYQRLVSYALTPPTALESIAATNIVSVEWETQISTLNELMETKGLSMIPILKDGKMEGIYSAWHLQTYLCKAKKPFDKSMELMEMYDHLNLNKEKENIQLAFRIDFCKASSTIEDLVSCFLQSAHASHYFKAIYITENGAPFESVLGVVTPHSLPSINPKILDNKLNL